MQVDPSETSTLTLSTLQANYLNFNANNNSQVYGWTVNWGSILANSDYEPSTVYLVTHRFEGNKPGFYQQLATNTLPGWIGAVPNTLPTAVSTNLPQMNNNSTAINFIRPLLAILGLANPGLGASNVQMPFFCSAKLVEFTCNNPRSLSTLYITTQPVVYTAGIVTAATNNISTTGDIFGSGVHTFTFRRLRPVDAIPREIKPQIVGTLVLNTPQASSTSFDATTGIQKYVFSGVDWGKVLGHPRKQGAIYIYRVSHRFVPNYIPNQYVSTAIAQPATLINSYPFTPNFLVSTNLQQGKNMTPGFPQSINNIFVYMVQALVSLSGYYNFPSNADSRDQQFIVQNPEDVSTVVITTTPVCGNATYTQAAATIVPIVQAAPNDYYTSGVHTFVFEFLGVK